MSRYSPRRQDGSNPDQTTTVAATSRPHPLSTRSFGTADNSPSKTYKRNSPLTERGSPVSRASSFSAGRLSSSSRKNDTADTSGESPAKVPKATGIPQANSINRDGTQSSHHTRTSSRLHQDNALSKHDPSSSSEYKHAQCTTDSNLPSLRRKGSEDAATKKEFSRIGPKTEDPATRKESSRIAPRTEDPATKKESSRIAPRTEDPATRKESSRIAPRTEDPAPRKESSRIAPRSLGRGNSESPSRSPQDSDGGSPSNIPLRPSPKRGVEGDKNSDQGASRLLRTSARPRAASGMIGAGSAIDEVKPLSTRTPKDLKLGDPTNRQAPSVNKTDKSPRVKSSPDGVRSPSSGSPNKEAESVNMTANSKMGSKIGELSKASSPSRKLEGTSSKQTFDRGDIKYNSCRSRIPTPNSPSGSRKGSESPVRQKLSSHSFTAPRTGEPANRTSPDEGCPPKETPESRAERIARYKDIRRKELASKIKYKADPETDLEPESVNISKTLNEEKPKTSKQTDIVTESSTAAKTNAARSATADSSKIICGMKVSKNIADRAKKRQERMLRNSQHLSAELIGRRAKISAVCSKPETEGSENHQTGESDLLRPEAGPGQSSNQLQPSPSQEMDLLSPGSLSVSGSDRDSTYLQLTSESSDLSPDDKRLSLTELESLPETRSSSDELNLPTEHGMVDSFCISEPSPSYEDIPNVREPIKSSESPLEEFVVAKKPDSLDLRLTTPPKIQRSSIEDSPENYTATSSCNLSSSSPESRISKLSSGSTFKDSRIPDLSSGLAATTTKEALNKENNPVSSPFEKVLRKVKSPPRSGIPDSSLSPVLSNIGENRNPKREEGNNDQPKVQTSPARNFQTSLSSDRIGEKVKCLPGGRLTDANISSVSTGVTDKGRRVVSEPDVESDDYTPKTPYKISQDNDRYSPPKTNEDNTPFRGIKGKSEPDVQRDDYISKSSIKAKDSSYSYSPPKTKEDNAPFRGIKGMSEPDVQRDDYISKSSIKAKESSYSYSPPKTKEDNAPFRIKGVSETDEPCADYMSKTSIKAKDSSHSYSPPKANEDNALFRGIKGMSEPDVPHDGYISKTSIKAKDSSYSYSLPKTNEDKAPSQAKTASVVTDNQTEGPAKLPLEKSRPRPPPSTVLYTKKLLESGSVKKDQKRIDYDLQKELDWLEHRKYQYADDSDEQKEKKLSVLEMVRAAEGKADTDEEKPRKPLGRTMSEARGRDATQSRKEILANRISNLGRTRSFALNSNRRAEPSTVADEAPLPMRESNLDELLMKNVAYLDDENVPKDPGVRSLHPAENLKLRKSLRKKKVAKHMSLPETGTSEEKRSFSKSESIKELGSAATELAASRATLKLKEHDPSSSKVQNVDSSYATSPFAKSPTSGVTPNSNKKISPKHDVTQKPLHGTNPVTNVTQTSKNLPGTRSIATKSVSPTAAASYKASDVRNKGLPSPEHNVTTAVPEQVDVRDSPHRKRIRSQSRGRPTAENIVDPAKRRRDKSGPRTSRLGALEENTDTKSASPHQELSPPEFPTTETSTALHSFENSNASTRPKPASSEGAPPPRRSRQRIRPEDIPAPIRDVIKASLGYEQDGTQPKAEPTRSAEIAQLQGTFRVSDAQRAGPQTAVQGNSAEETIKEFEEFAPVMSRRLSDTNKSTITTIKNPRINPDSVSIQEQGQPRALKTRANSLDSATITASPKIAYNIRKFSLAENNNTSKVLPFHSNDWNSADNLASNLAPIKESRQSSEKSVSHRDAEEAEKGLGLSEGTAKPSEPLAGLDRNHFSGRSGRAEDKSKAPAEDLTDVKLVVREDSNHGNKNREAVESAQSLNFQSTSRISLASKPGEQTSSQVRKPNVTRPDGDYSREKVLSTKPDKPELSSSPGTSTTTHTPLETTVAHNRTTISGSSEISVTPSVPVTSDIVATSTLSAGSDTVVPSTPAKSDTVVSSTPSATRDTVVSSSSSATSDASLSEVTEVPVTSKQVRNTTTGSVTMPVSVTSEAPSNAKLTPHVTEVISSSPVSQNPIGTSVTSSENVTLKPTVTNVTKNTVTNVTKPGVTEERKPIVTNDIKPAVTDETRFVANVTQPAVTNVTKPGVTEERKPIVTNDIKPAVTDETRSVANVTQPAVTNVTKPGVTEERKPIVTNVIKPAVTDETRSVANVTQPAVTNVTKPGVTEERKPIVTNVIKPAVTDETRSVANVTQPAVTNVTKPGVTEERKPIVTNDIKPAVTDETRSVANVTQPTVTNVTKPGVTEERKPIVTNVIKPAVTDETRSVANVIQPAVTNVTKPGVTGEQKPAVTNVTKPSVTNESVTKVTKPTVTNATKPIVTDETKAITKPAVTNVTVTEQTKSVTNLTNATVTDQTKSAIKNVTKPKDSEEKEDSVTNVTKPAVTNATVTDQTKSVTNATKPVVTNATKPAVTDQSKAVTKPAVTDEIKHSVTNVAKPPVTNATVTDQTKPVTNATVTDQTKPVTNATVTDQTKPVTNATVTDQTKPVANATKPTVTDQTNPVTKPAVTDEIKHSVTNVTKPAVTNATVTDQTKPVTNATVTDQTKPVTNATKPAVTDQTKAVTKPAVTDEIKHSVTNVTKPAVTNATVTDQTKPVTNATVTDQTKPVTNATKPAVTDQTKAVTKPAVTDEIKHSVTNVTKPAVTNTTVTKPVTTEDQKPIVTPTSKAPIKNIISNTPATVTTVTTSAMPVSTNSINLGQTSPVMTAPVSSNVNSPTITTISQNTNVTKTHEKTSPREEKTVTTPTSDLKNNSVSKLVTSTPTSTLSTGMTNQSPKTPNSSTAPNLRSVSLSPTLTESQDLSRSLELTPKDIENGNVMTQSAQFSQPRMSEGSISVPRRGILKRSSSLRSNNVNNELIDPELAVVFQARRIKEKSENPTSDHALDEEEEEDEDDSAFSGKFQGSDSLLSEIMAESEESGEKPLSVAERISKMETKISISTSGYTTPKTPRSRLGSVARTLSEQESKKSVLSQEELFNKLTDLARSKEASQERQKRYHRSRDDWRTRTQPVTLKEVEQADSLQSVCAFRALVMKRSSINIFEQLQELDKRRRLSGPKTEYPQPYTPPTKRDRRNNRRYKTLPVTAEELMSIPESETISLEFLKSQIQVLRESKVDSGIVSSGSDVEKESLGSDSARSLTTDADNEDDDFTQMSVAARASLFQQMEEKSKKSASGAKRYIDRKRRERSRTQPITEEEVKTAAEIAEEDSRTRRQSLVPKDTPTQTIVEIEEPQSVADDLNEPVHEPAITLEKLIQNDLREDEKDVTKHSDELTRQTLADKVKLFSSEREVTQDKPNRTDAPVIRRRNRRFASRFSTQALKNRVSQPITTEEMENVFRISPLAISLVKPPDPDILKGLPLNAQRELIAQYAETCLSQQGSRAGSRAGSRPGSLAGSRRGSIEESEDSKAETKGILKMADYQKDLQQVKSILKSESGRDSPEREIKSILKADADRKDNEPSRSILKQDSNEQVQGETRSILKSSSEPEPRRSSKQLDSEPRGILKSSETMETNSVAPKTSEPKSALKKDSHLEKNGTEPRGILKKESSFDCKKEPEKGVLKHPDSKDGKEVPCQDGLQGILKKESSIENLTSEDSDIGDVLTNAEKQLAPGVGEGKKKEYRRGSDERYLTQPVTEVEKKSPESPRKLQRYGSRQHKTQPITPEEKKEATQVIQPVVKMSGSLAERLQALQKSGEEDWKKRLSKHSNSPSPSPDRELRLSSPETTPVRPANLSERMSLLRSSQTSWRSRVEESDAKAFTVEGKLSKSGQMTRERSVVTKVKQTVKCTDPDQLNSATSPTTPTKGEWKIPIPKEIIVSETTSLEETSDHSPTIVKLPELKDDGLDQFFGSSPNLFDKSELLDISVDDFDEIFQTSQNILIHSVKARPKKKVQARSKNPLKSRSANLERQEYEEYKTNVAEMELKRIKKEALSKDAGFAEAALAGLASKENFSKIELRKTDTSVPSPGGNRYLPYKPLMLLHIKGRRHVQTRLVEPCCRNVNLGDCYVLVTPEKVINWIGEYSNIIEKAKSADIAAHIQQKKDMGFKASSGVITIDSRKTSGSVFWSLLDGHESECQECGGADEDEIYENAIISTNMVYQIEKNRLVPFEEYWGGLPRYEMLKSHQVFVFDFGAEVYIWQGKKAVPQRRRLGMELAQQLFDKGYNYEMSSINPLSPLQGVSEGGPKGSSSQRPSWSLIAKVNENMETVLFREKFADWPDSARLIKVKSVDSNSNKTDNGDLIPYDAQKLIEKKIPEALLMTLDGSQVGRGTYWSEDMGGFIQEFEINTLAVTVWHILEFDHYRLDPLSNGQFHDGDTYVVRWEYRIVATGAKGGARRSAAGRERCAYFFWQGQTSTITEKGASALMTVELDEERGPQVRVLQGKEPPCFLNLFQGQMVVHIGKREEEETNTQGAWRFYALRNEKRNEMCLIEIDAQISSLRSRSSFILFNTQSGKVYVWHGAKSPQNTRKLAVEAVNLIEDRHPLEMGLAENIHVNITEMNEGSEKPEFWMALRSRDRSRYVSLLNDPRSYNVSLRLFQFTSVSGVIEVTEIRNPTITPDHLAPYPFLQSDLYKVSQPALFLLDCGYEVYLWQGWWPEGDEEIENVLTGSAQSRLMIERRCAMQTAVDYCQAKNVSTPIKPFLVFAGLEPLKFTNIFPFWNIDHTVKELSLKDGKIDGDLVSVEDELNRLSLVRYSFKELLERPLPEDVDPLKLESYLSDQEFEDVLKMTRSEYYELPTWKQSKLKQDIGLF